MFKRIDPDRLIHYIDIAQEVIAAVVGVLMILGVIVGVWFIG